jgi:hypothetical protein
MNKKALKLEYIYSKTQACLYKNLSPHIVASIMSNIDENFESDIRSSLNLWSSLGLNLWFSIKSSLIEKSGQR